MTIATCRRTTGHVGARRTGCARPPRRSSPRPSAVQRAVVSIRGIALRMPAERARTRPCVRWRRRTADALNLRDHVAPGTVAREPGDLPRQGGTPPTRQVEDDEVDGARHGRRETRRDDEMLPAAIGRRAGGKDRRARPRPVVNPDPPATRWRPAGCDPFAAPARTSSTASTMIRTSGPTASRTACRGEPPSRERFFPIRSSPR